MTLSQNERVLAAWGLAYAAAIIEKMPPHWLRPLLRHDVGGLFERLNSEEPVPSRPAKALSLARRHVAKLKIAAVNCAAVEEPREHE